MPKKSKEEKKKEANRKYYLKNKARLNEENLERYHTKYKNDPEYKENQRQINKDHYQEHREELLIKSAIRKKQNKLAKITNGEKISLTKCRVAKNPRQRIKQTDTPDTTIKTNNLPTTTEVLPASDIGDLYESVHSTDITGFAEFNPILNQMQIDAPFLWQEKEDSIYNNPLLASQLMFGSKPKTFASPEQSLNIEDGDNFNDFIQTQLELN